MLKVGWFPELSPWEQLIFDDLKNIIESSYKQYGFVHIETPAVERNEILLKGWEESSKQVFGLYWMAQWADDLKGYGLHFDLTVPFTRYVLDHVGKLTFPFKRYQIQPVWRWERAQKGRFRQFYQADIDVIWRYNEKLNHTYYDAETLFVVNKTINNIRKKYFPERERVMHVNNRKISTGFFDRVTNSNQELITGLYKLTDNFYKIGEQAFKEWLEKLGLNNDQIQLVVDFSSSRLDELDDRFGDNPLYQKGVGELRETFGLLGVFNKNAELHFYYDPYIVRGLDYYTWTVFEVIDSKNVERGALSAWWRYENLAQSLDPKAERFDGVGWSIGLSRLASFIVENSNTETQTHVDYLFVNFEETNNDVISIAQNFVEKWYSVEIYPEPVKLGKQFSYAEKKGIPNVVVFGSSEKDEQKIVIKSMTDWTSQKHPLS